MNYAGYALLRKRNLIGFQLKIGKVFLLKKNSYPIPKISLLKKKGKDKKVQVTEQPKDVISL